MALSMDDLGYFLYMEEQEENNRYTDEEDTDQEQEYKER